MKWMTGLFCLIIFSCGSVKNTIRITNETKLKLVGKYELPHNMQYANTTVGGLSGIDYDRKNDIYYIISDDGSKINPARFYKVKISVSEKGIEDIKFIQMNYLKKANGQLYPSPAEDPANTPDPETIRMNGAKNFLVWGNEGQKIYHKNDTIISDPAIFKMDLEGRLIDSFIIPSNLRMHKHASGPRNNGSFEGISFSKNYKTLLVSMEEPLYQDGPRAGLKDSFGIIRITEFDVKSKKAFRQCAYKIEPVAFAPTPLEAFRINGISEILFVDQNKLLVVERSYSTGIKASTIKIFLTDLQGASDILNYPNIKDVSLKFVKKKLLLDLDALGIYIDNLEGITFGPILPNGNPSLIMIADNNFDEKEISQIFLFEIQD